MSASSRDDALTPPLPPEIQFEAAPHFRGQPLATYGRRERDMGKGSYGTVYLTDRGYAIKEIQMGTEGLLTNDILSEIVYPISIHHPSIIKYHDVYITPAKISVVMSAYDGDLYHWIRGGSSRIHNLPLFKLVAIKITSALAYLGSRNILHRDIKPLNILYRQSLIDETPADVILADFGLATGNECLITQRDFGVYTINYRAPEVLLGLQAYTGAAEVWALGCTLYEIWTGYQLILERTRRSIFLELVYKVGAGALGTPFNQYILENLWRYSFFPVGYSEVGYTPHIEELPAALYGRLGVIASNSATAKAIRVGLGREAPTLWKAPGSNPAVWAFLRQLLQPDPDTRVSIYRLQRHPLLSEDASDFLPLRCIERVALYERLHLDSSSSAADLHIPGAIGRMLEAKRIAAGGKITDASYFLGVDLFYRYLHFTRLAEFDPDLVGACLLLGWTFFERFNEAELLGQLVRLKIAIKKEEVVAKQRQVVQALNFDLLAAGSWARVWAADWVNSENRSLGCQLLLAISPIKQLYQHPDVVSICSNLGFYLVGVPSYISKEEYELYSSALISFYKRWPQILMQLEAGIVKGWIDRLLLLGESFDPELSLSATAVEVEDDI